jgi:hypothetical protein
MKAPACILLFVLAASTLLAQTNAVPFLNQPLVPAGVVPGSGEFTLVANGTGFAPGAALYWNGSPRVTIVNSSSSLQAIINAADVAKEGTASVTVVNPAPGGGTSNAVFFPVREPAAAVGLAITPRFSEGVAAVGDFNNDGKLDVAVGEYSYNGYEGTGSVSVYLGNGDGTFSAPIVTSVPFGVQVLVPANVNSDGNLDLLVSQYPSNESSAPMVVFLGNGDGTFTQGVQLSGTPTAVGDWNGDGNLDLVLEELYVESSFSSVYLGDGQGNFTLSQYQIGNGGYDNGPAGATAVGDFNGDGKLDLAFEGVAIDLGNGDGTFQDPVYYTPEYSGYGIAVADVNNDGKLDIVTSGLSVLLGNGDGTFTPYGGVNVGVGDTVTLGDFNGDGQLDAAVSNTNGGLTLTLDILLGNGNGTFQNPTAYLISNSVSTNVSVAIGDFSGDGRIDFVESGGTDTMLLLQDSVLVTPYSLAFPEQDTGTSSSPQTVTLTNVGSTTLSLENISIAGGNNFSQTNNCGTAVASGAACSILVTFSPRTPGNKTGGLSISYQGLGSPNTVSMSGFGVNAPAVTLKPSILSFPAQLLGTTSEPQIATLTNIGSLPVNVSGISTSGAFTQTNNCPASLTYSQSCQIEVQYAPTVRGDQSGLLSVMDNAGNSPQSVKLNGAGTVVSLSATGINFGDQQVGTTSLAIPIKVTNTSSVPLSISQISIGGADPSDFAQTSNCGNGIPAGGNCTIKVSFTPTATGTSSATLSITDNGGASPQNVTLTGTGT